MDFAYKNMIARNFIRLNHKQQCEILAVRNIESVRKFMLDSKIIGKSEHFRFIESLKEAKNVAYFGVYECKNNANSHKANSACSDFLGSASASSLQRTESASHSSASHNPKNSSTILEFANANSSLGETFRPFENFEHSLESSLASRPKFSKEAKASTADTRILGEMQGDFVDSMESTAESSENNPVIARLDEVKSWQSKKTTESHNDASTSSLREHSPKQSIYENNLIEFRRSERVKSFTESAESHTESNAELHKDSSDSIESNHNMDLQVWVSCGRNARHANPYGLSRNDKLKTTTHKNTISSNDDSTLSVIARKQSDRSNPPPFYRLCEHSQNVYQSIKNANFIKTIESQKDSNDSVESSEKMDCHEAFASRNDDSNATPHKTPESQSDSGNDASPIQPSQGDTSQLLGVVCFNHIDFANKNAFFGIYSIPDKKNGANLLAMLEFIAFEVLNLHALYAKVLSTNARALSFYAKHNFTHCGKMPDAIRRDGRFLDIEILAKFKERV